MQDKADKYNCATVSFSSKPSCADYGAQKADCAAPCAPAIVNLLVKLSVK